MTTKKVILYTDGGARGNPGPAAIGCIILDERGNTLKEYSQAIGNATNNMAEYTALVKGLELCKSLGAAEVNVFSDSELLVNQLIGSYKIRAVHLKPLYDAVRILEASFGLVTYAHVRRENPDTVRADALVNQALDAEQRKK